MTKTVHTSHGFRAADEPFDESFDTRSVDTRSIDSGSVTGAQATDQPEADKPEADKPEPGQHKKAQAKAKTGRQGAVADVPPSPPPPSSASMQLMPLMQPDRIETVEAPPPRRKIRFWRRLVHDRLALAAFILLMILMALSMSAWLIAPQNPYDLRQIDIMDAELPPVWAPGSETRFLLGTDTQGRDLLSTILFGMGVSFLVGICAVLLQAVLGIMIGLASGYAGGRLDGFLMRIADIQLSLSTLMVAIITLGVFKASLGTEYYGSFAILMMILVIGVAEWPHFARTLRASVLAEKEKDYVDAARVIGLGHFRIMFRHILPNTLPPLMVIGTVQVANAIMAEAALSFLGLGMPDSQPSLGALIRSGFDHILSGAWWITAFPSIVLVLLVLAINVLGDFLRDVLNPRLTRGM